MRRIVRRLNDIDMLHEAQGFVPPAPATRAPAPGTVVRPAVAGLPDRSEWQGRERRGATHAENADAPGPLREAYRRLRKDVAREAENGGGHRHGATLVDLDEVGHGGGDMADTVDWQLRAFAGRTERPGAIVSAGDREAAGQIAAHRAALRDRNHAGDGSRDASLMSDLARLASGAPLKHETRLPTDGAAVAMNAWTKALPAHCRTIQAVNFAAALDDGMIQTMAFGDAAGDRVRAGRR